MTKRLIGWIAVAAVSLLLHGPANAVELRLLPNITVDGDMVTLADMFGDIGEAGDTVVARGPAPGKRLAITVAAVHRLTRSLGLAWMPLRSVKSITVTRNGRRIPVMEIEAAILDALRDQTTADGLRIDLANRNPKFFVATGVEDSLYVESMNYDARTGRFAAVLVAAAGSPDEARADFRGRAVEMVELPVLNKRMAKGEIIVAGDIDWLDWQARRVPRDAVTDEADLVGQAAGRTLRPGRPIRERDVNEPVVVARGSDVRLVYRTKSMTLTVGGRALEDGAMGRIIRVLNNQSKVVIEAKVVGGNVLSVASPTFLALK